jgi:radical SAM superfamily enzyme YgiQ (UPF0313 family)
LFWQRRREVKIQLVAPEFNFGKRLPETPSRALLILGTLAKQRGHDVRITHCDIEPIDWDWKPDVVGITCNTFQIRNAREVVKQAKEHGAKTIIGGAQAAYWRPEDGAINKAVIGEGENEFLKFIHEKPDIINVDDVPMPDYSLVDLNRFSGVSPVGVVPSLAIMASRGCGFHCTFCNTPLFWGRQVRYRNPQLVVDEVELLHNQYGINEIFFQDDTMNLNHEWAFAIFNELIKRGLSKEMLFKIDCRVNEKLLTREYIELAKKAGVWNIFFGIESGSQYMLDRMKKGITVAEIKRAVKLTKEYGINPQCSFIVGLPGESLGTLRETDKLIQEAEIDFYGWCFACPFPGTELDKEVTLKGHKRTKDWIDYAYGDVYCRTDSLDYNEIQAFGGFSRG